MTLELLIVGAGPAGVSAALWAKSFGLGVRVIEAAPLVGGQLHLVRFHPQELPGIVRGTGPEIASTFSDQLEALGIPAECGPEAATLEGAEVRTRDGDRIGARAVLIATGQRRRRLEVPGESRLEDHGVSYSARRDRDRFAAQEVVVVGGGDGAFENALLLTAVGCRVLLVVRGEPRAHAEFRGRVAADDRIEVLDRARVVEFHGDAALEAVTLDRHGERITRPVRGAVIKIGMTPNTEWCRDLARDDAGYLVVDARGRTSRSGIWAAGDVVRPLLAGIGVAMGSAAIAVADVRAVLRAE
jgi:thioredoxin reductase (NADPH)